MNFLNCPPELEFSEYFVQACGSNKLSLVKELLTIKNVNINYREDAGFRAACEFGHLEIIQYLLTSPELKKHSNINSFGFYGYADQGLLSACANNHLEVVKYLLCSSELKVHSNIHSNDDYNIIRACEQGNKEIVEFLLLSSELKEHANINAQNGRAFKYALQNEHMHVVEFLTEYVSRENKEEILINFIQQNNQKIIDYLIFNQNVRFKQENISKLKKNIGEDKTNKLLYLMERKDIYLNIEKSLNIKNNLKTKSKKNKI